MRLTLGRKLGFGFAAVLVLVVLNAALAYRKASAVKETQDRIIGVHMPSIGACKDLQRDLKWTQSKGRQAILAGGDTARWEAAKKGFDAAWDDIGSDIGRLDGLSPRWTLQANRDRLVQAKDHLVALRETQ